VVESKVTIKVNVNKVKNRAVSTTPASITVWHTGRILVALSILAAAGLLVVFYEL